MGYYTTKFSTIFKGSVMMAMKERRKSRHLVHEMHRLFIQIHEKLPDLIEKKHRVTKALKELNHIVDRMKKVEEDEKAIPLDVMMQEDNLLDAAEKYMET